MGVRGEWAIDEGRARGERPYAMISSAGKVDACAATTGVGGTGARVAEDDEEEEFEKAEPNTSVHQLDGVGFGLATGAVDGTGAVGATVLGIGIGVGAAALGLAAGAAEGVAAGCGAAAVALETDIV